MRIHSFFFHSYLPFFLRILVLLLFYSASLALSGCLVVLPLVLFPLSPPHSCSLIYSISFHLILFPRAFYLSHSLFFTSPFSYRNLFSLTRRLFLLFFLCSILLPLASATATRSRRGRILLNEFSTNQFNANANRWNCCEHAIWFSFLLMKRFFFSFRFIFVRFHFNANSEDSKQMTTHQNRSYKCCSGGGISKHTAISSVALVARVKA